MRNNIFFACNSFSFLAWMVEPLPREEITAIHHRKGNHENPQPGLVCILTLRLLPARPIPEENKNLVLQGKAALGTVPDGRLLVAYVASGLDGDRSRASLERGSFARHRFGTIPGPSPPPLPAQHPRARPEPYHCGFHRRRQEVVREDDGPGGFSTKLQLDLGPGAAAPMQVAWRHSQGTTQEKEFALPAPPWFPKYMQLLQEECGIEWVTVEDDSVMQEPRPEPRRDQRFRQRGECALRSSIAFARAS